MRHNRLIFAAAMLSLPALATSEAAHAAGVAAGTLIQNTATATFTSAGTPGTVNSNTVTVRVDQLIDVAVAGLNSSPVPASATDATISYSVTNTGNGPDSFNILVDPAVSGNPFAGIIRTIAIDVNNDGAYTAGTDQVIANGAATPQLAADTPVRIVVVMGLPAGATDGQTSQIRLTATSAIGSGPAGTLLAGRGQGGVDAVVGLSQATGNALDSIIARLAVIALTKSALIADPFGGTTPVPGATVTYSIVARATGSGTADNVHVTDAIPAGTTYLPGSVLLNGAALTDPVDGDAGTASAAGIDVTLGTIVGGSADNTVSFRVRIN